MRCYSVPVTPHLFLVLGLTSGFIQLAERAPTTSRETDAADTFSRRVEIQIEGPLARVSVERRFQPAQLKPFAGAPVSLLDLALPDGAFDVRMDVRSPGVASGAWVGLAEVAARVPEGITAALERAPADPETRHRLVLEGARPDEVWHLRYRFRVPLACERGRWTLRFPGAVDLAPVPSRVTVQAGRRRTVVIAGREARAGLRGAEGEAPMQAPWTVQVEPDAPRGAEAAAWWVGPPARRTGRETLLGVCRRVPDVHLPWPQSVMLVVDVSRSVSALGLSLERDLARALLEALPTGTRWNAVLFDRRPRPLFPLSRLITGESLRQLDEALVPAAQANGTDPGAALALAARLSREESEAAAGGGRSWMLLITDGALPEGARLPDPTGHVWSAVGVALSRPGQEQAPAAQHLFAYAAFVKGGTGVLRRPPADDLAAAARGMVDDLRRGGDWFAEDGPPGAWQVGARGLAPGEGVWAAWPARRRPPVLSFRGAGRVWRLPLRSRVVRDGWPAAVARLPTGAEPAPGVRVVNVSVAPPPLAETPAGELERSVLKNALALAFLPRARACYLNRPAATAAARDLAGRVRLRMEIDRGEVLGARIETSSLQHPAIEACLTEAAWAVALPRPAGRDAAVEAILNLVFRPASPAGADTPVADRDIEVLLEPLRVREPDFDLRLLDAPAEPALDPLPDPR